MPARQRYLEIVSSYAQDKFKQKLLILLYFSYIWLPVRSKIRKQVSTLLIETSSSTIKTSNNEDEANEEEEEDESKDNLITSDDMLDKDIEFYLGIPRLGYLGYFYYAFSTTVHVLILINNSILIYRNKFLKLATDNSSYFSCHSPRFVLHEHIQQDNMIWFSWCISVLHLFWRYTIFAIGKEFDLKLIPFVTSNDELFARSSLITLYNYQLFKPEQLEYDNNYQTKPFVSKQKLLSTDELIDFKSTNNEKETILKKKNELSKKKHMIHFMYSFIFFNYYELKGRKGIRYGFRPNRTNEARIEMIWITNIAFNVAFILFLLATCIITSVAIRTIIFHQAEIYQGCEKSSWDLIYFNRLLGSLILSATIFFDSAFAFLCPTNVAFILIYDLFIYWRKITLKIDYLLRLIFKYYYTAMENNRHDYSFNKIIFTHHNYIFKGNNEKLISTILPTIVEKRKRKRLLGSSKNRVRDNNNSQYDDTFDNNTNSELELYNFSLPSSPSPPPTSTSTSSSSSSSSSLSSSTSTTTTTTTSPSACFKTRIFEGRNLIREINELQSLVGDFFIQLRTSDRFVSLLVTYAVLIWLVTNGIITLTGLQIKQTVGSFIIKAFQVLGFLIISIMSIFILTLKRKTEPAYKTMSSLMALDPTKSKKRWIGLMKYYTEKPHYGITLWRNQTFTLLTYFKLLSYTFTLITLVENMNWYGRKIFLDNSSIK